MTPIGLVRVVSKSGTYAPADQVDSRSGPILTYSFFWVALIQESPLFNWSFCGLESSFIVLGNNVFQRWVGIWGICREMRWIALQN